MKAIRRSRLVWGRLTSLSAAIIAVLAALGTLLAHHRSVSALASKNAAILAQGRAFDAYNAYESKEVRVTVYQALLASDLVRESAALARLKSVAREETKSSAALLAKGEALDEQATAAEERGETLMRSYETLQFATTFFEIAIVLVSIATLTGSRFFLPAGGALTAAGLVLFVLGLFQGR